MSRDQEEQLELAGLRRERDVAVDRAEALEQRLSRAVLDRDAAERQLAEATSYAAQAMDLVRERDDARKDALLWRNIAAAVMSRMPAPGRNDGMVRRVTFSALESFAIRLSIPYAEVSEGKHGRLKVYAFLASLPPPGSGLLPAVSDAEGGPAVSSAHGEGDPAGPAGEGGG